MKTISLLIIAIGASTGVDYTVKCTAVNLQTKDTGTLYIYEGCIMIGDTINVPYEDKRRNSK
jgi:hypothetical protein